MWFNFFCCFKLYIKKCLILIYSLEIVLKVIKNGFKLICNFVMFCIYLFVWILVMER